MLAHLGFGTRAEVSEIVEHNLVRVHEKMKAEVLETVADPFHDAFQTGFLGSSEGLDSAMFNTVEHDLTEAVCARWGHFLTEIQLVCLIQSESIVHQIVKYVFSSTKILV